MDTKHKNLDLTVVENLSNQDQLWTRMQVVHGKVEDLEVITSKHESKVAALQTATGVFPDREKNRIDLLEEEAVDFGGKRHQRVEKVLGLEPLTKENAEAQQKL